jgi:periplasmic copper chaperone A
LVDPGYQAGCVCARLTADNNARDGHLAAGFGCLFASASPDANALPNAASHRSPPVHPRAITERFGAICLAIALIFATAPAWAHGYKVGELDIEHPWSRATPAGAKVASGYLTIKNGSATPDRLVSVSAEIAGKSEMHEMNVTDGVMTMRELAGGIEIPANGEVKFAPGAYHLMFKDLKRPLIKGERFAGELTFEKAGTISIEFVVDAMGGDEHKNHGG